MLRLGAELLPSLVRRDCNFEVKSKGQGHARSVCGIVTKRARLFTFFWNSLPDSIRTEPNSAVIRKHLKTHFSVQHLMFVNLLFISLLRVNSVMHLCPFCNRRIINVR